MQLVTINGEVRVLGKNNAVRLMLQPKQPFCWGKYFPTITLILHHAR
jgi:hypothetical protein